ncbi:MAG TPA: thiamine-phosphate kinase [Gemmatimonadales bacterium]
MELGPGPEFDRIRRIAERLGPRAATLGDDCALLQVGETTLAISTDISVEDVHFRRSWMTDRELGWRATSAALSDLAAEGASPLGVMVSVGVPEVAGDALERVMEGVGEAASAFGAQVLGGDLSSAKLWILDLTVIGTAQRPVTRDGAKSGDNVWVTGTLGGSRAALERWLAGGEPDPAARISFVHPTPRITAGRRLAELGAHAMIDLSDGLVGDAGHLAAASGCAIAIDLAALPLHPAVAEAARLAGVDPQQYAALGGEDYELLVAMPPEFGEPEAQALAAKCGVRFSRVGAVSAGQGATFWRRGAVVELRGFSHFA